MEIHEQSILHSLEFTTWIKSLRFTLIAFIVFFSYLIIANRALTLSVVNYSIAATADIMLGSSLALGSLCYYFHFLESKIFYRKYLGLTGFGLALLYSFLLLFQEPQKYFYGFSSNAFSWEVILGLLAMLIFTVMALISNKWALLKIGPHTWKLLLRLGYIAYFFLILRAVILEKEIWWAWLQVPEGLPPIRFILAIMASSVLLLRLSVITSKYFERRSAIAV